MKKEVYLVQTDTTVGFLSQSKEALIKAKNRSPKNPFLITTAFHIVQKTLSRTPKKYKKLVRRSCKTTFIYPNKKAIRVVKDVMHKNFLKEFDFLYSSSANKTKEKFDKEYAYEKADIIIEDSRGFYETSPSTIIKIGKKTLEKIR
ncbi:MAG TPA: Sua5 YciO YrdC YwlC family protein [Campylobacterales bacterium]|nr:Sua5 YciO YrdC YwlC family protein [Campylobacterales bacterium]